MGTMFNCNFSVNEGLATREAEVVLVSIKRQGTLKDVSGYPKTLEISQGFQGVILLQGRNARRLGIPSCLFLCIIDLYILRNMRKYVVYY